MELPLDETVGAVAKVSVAPNQAGAAAKEAALDVEPGRAAVAAALAAAPASTRAFGKCTLPNGLTLSYPSTPEEVISVWRENFVDQQYLQNGVELREGDCVIDVGANTGLFALFAAQSVGASGRVIALEPSPDTAACCGANAASHAAWRVAGGHGLPAAVELVAAACGDGSCDTLNLVIYDKASTIASIIPDDAAAHGAVEAYITTQMEAGNTIEGSIVQRAMIAAGGALLRAPIPSCRALVKGLVRLYVRNMLASRREVPVRMVTVSQVMAERDIGEVALLKIDVERAELDVLRGVAAADWPRIRQVAVEVHEPLLPEVLALLKGPAGFTRVTVTAADACIGPGMFNLHAVRGPAAVQEAGAAAE